MNKDPAAVSLGRKGRLGKSRNACHRGELPVERGTRYVRSCAGRVATDLAEIRLLSEKIERVIFHKQFENG